MAVATCIAAATAAFVLYFFAGRLAGSTAGRLALLCGVFFLPLIAVGTGATEAYRASSSTEFCLSCHEMERYGQSLFVDDRTVLPAVHYQKRLVDRDHACFACHTNYTMFGDIEAKLDGLKHVWVHYLGEPPEQIELYAPYASANCLHCHDDARSYVEHPAHGPVREALTAGEKSCLDCHRSGHALPLVEEGRFWLGPM